MHIHLKICNCNTEKFSIVTFEYSSQKHKVLRFVKDAILS